ncbi:MAG: AAA family ATPase, partial [Bacteroidetes bacterium]|nr:AAA family ATPase [Bacteroidota bacterium]
NRNQNRPKLPQTDSVNLSSPYPRKKSTENGNGEIPYFQSTMKWRTWEKNIDQLTVQIDSLEAEIREYRQPATELNKELHKYLGHGAFKLEPKENGYQIMRGNVRADALSEGEKTALALLYFLKSLADQRFALEKGIVVLDDPVSSLDSNALYLAFGYIKERTKNASQLFVLTHNFAFFRLVRNWFHHCKGQRKKDIAKRPARFYMLERIFEPAPPVSTIRRLDPLLEQFESEYQYLFARVVRGAQTSGRISLEEAYMLSNVSRRLLEAFLAFRYPNIPVELHKKMEKVDFEEASKTCIMRFVNVHSHDHIIDEPTHSPAVFNESRAVLNKIIDLIEAEDLQHHKAMIELCDN